MERKFYKTPRTKLFSVELEGTFAGSADVANPDTSNGRIDVQNVNQSFGDFDDSFGGSEWSTSN